MVDFLQNDGFFTVEFVGRERRMKQNIRQNIDGKGQILFQHFDIKGCRFPRRAGIEIAADVFDFLGDLAGGAGGRAFEHHVFKQVRNAVDFGGFIHRPDPDPRAQSHGVEFVHFVGYDSQGIRQTGNGAHFQTSFFTLFSIK